MTSQPMMIASERVFKISGSGIFMMSWESTVKSASLLTSIVPLSFSLIGRHCFKCSFIKIENRAVRAIPDRMRLDLESATQRFFEHWTQLLRFFGEITRSFRRIIVRLKQRRAARTESAVENNFDRAL